MAFITVPLAIGQTIIWAATFYLFPALLPTWEVETGWSKSQLTGAFTLSLLAAAVVSPLAGRLIDSGHGRTLMVGGTAASVLCLIALSQVGQLWQFYLVWLLLGLCMAASLYEPCFANLIRHLGDNAKPAITRITLIAGLAGTVAFPTAHTLTALMSWQQAVLCFAAGTALITLPPTYLAISSLQQRYPVDRPVRSGKAAKLPYGKAFWLLASAFMLISVVHGMIVTHILPLLAERGVATSFAILAASMIGPMQVFGRLLMMATEKRLSTLTTAMACFAGMAVGISALALAGANQVLILSFVVLHGSAYGVTSIIRPMLTRQTLGAANFGQISGRMGGLFMFGTAIAPFGGSLIWRVSGYTSMLVLSAAMMVAGLFILRLATSK
ncbi:MAG: MFS transporter [Rhizobiaceae bacterium]